MDEVRTCQPGVVDDDGLPATGDVAGRRDARQRVTGLDKVAACRGPRRSGRLGGGGRAGGGGGGSRRRGGRRGGGGPAGGRGPAVGGGGARGPRPAGGPPAPP